jgi:hypothetical protein
MRNITTSGQLRVMRKRQKVLHHIVSSGSVVIGGALACVVACHGYNATTLSEVSFKDNHVHKPERLGQCTSDIVLVWILDWDSLPEGYRVGHDLTQLGLDSCTIVQYQFVS